MTRYRAFQAHARALRHATALFLRDVGQGLLVISHNTLALLGLGMAALLMLFANPTELRGVLEHRALSWLTAREEARQQAEGSVSERAEPEILQRVLALDPAELPPRQAALAQWLSRRYRVAPEAVARVVQESARLSERTGLELSLIVAIVGIESSFNPYAQSAAGAQGLMQVMTPVHQDKYTRFGGPRAALDPVANLRVGVQVLKESIQRAGSVTEGLRWYVGAANRDDDGGYTLKVLTEQEAIKAVLAGRLPPNGRSVV